MNKTVSLACASLGLAFLSHLNPSFAGFPPVLDESALDRTVDPCHNFYDFACGGWNAKAVIPGDRPALYRSFTSIQEENLTQLRQILENYKEGDISLPSTYAKKLGDFYAACMNESAAEGAATQLLPSLMNEVDSAQNKTELTRKMAHLKLMGIGTFLRVSAIQDLKDSSQMIASFDQGGLGLPNRDYYLDSSADKVEKRKLYQEHIQSMFQLLGASEEVAEGNAKTVLKIETELAKQSLSPADRRDPTKLYHPMHKPEFQKLSPRVAWEIFFETLEIKNIKMFNVAVPQFFSGLSQLVEQTSLEDMKTYMKWHVLSSMAPSLGKKYVDEHFNFYEKALQGQKEQKERWKKCVELADAHLQDALGEAYVKKTFGESGKTESLKILENVQSTFKKYLSTLAWMDEPTRAAALEKLNAIRNKIGYPEKWENLSSLHVDRAYHFLNILSSNSFWVKKDLAKIGKPVDRSLWQMTPPTVNAYYEPSLNEIVFPAGILQPPFFSAKSPKAANYGAIGMVIGHELTHGFDDEGRQYDASGNLKDWWSPKVGEQFSKKAECLEKQYSSYTIVDGIHLNGKLTLGENIADLGGLKIAYSAFQVVKEDLAAQKKSKNKGFTEDQKFFISFAQGWCAKVSPELEKLRAATDPHSPPRYRVNGVVVNSPDFAKAFSCQPGSPMAPRDRCIVW
jgi:predicted metalloendopeptidase